MFNVKEKTEAVVKWIQDWFEKNGPGCNAVIGISGGKDSSVVAALCVRALGRDRVIGVLMPSGVQPDIDASHLLVQHLGIEHYIVNIGSCRDALVSELTSALGDISNQTVVNLPARLRMATVYAVAQSRNGRVANTCNASEDYVGYSTRYGDAAGDFSPLANFTVTEVRAIGRELDLPAVLVDKVPTDGLCGKTDEDNLGFTYDTLDRYIREGVCEDEQTRAKIDRMHEMNLFKLRYMDCFEG